MARYPVFFSDGGSPATGLTPSITWRVLSDGTSPGAPPAVSELDSVNAPGWYYFDATPSEQVVVTVDGGASLPTVERYKSNVIDVSDFAASEARLASLDSPFTALKEALADQVWDEAVVGHASAGSFAVLLQVVAGLSLGNMRIANPAYDSDGRLVSGTLKVYANGMEATNDGTTLDTFTVTATYDVDGNLQTFLSAS